MLEPRDKRARVCWRGFTLASGHGSRDKGIKPDTKYFSETRNIFKRGKITAYRVRPRVSCCGRPVRCWRGRGRVRRAPPPRVRFAHARQPRSSPRCRSRGCRRCCAAAGCCSSACRRQRASCGAAAGFAQCDLIKYIYFKYFKFLKIFLVCLSDKVDDKRSPSDEKVKLCKIKG